MCACVLRFGKQCESSFIHEYYIIFLPCLDMSDVKTETISVLLRVGETLRLHCTLESAAESVVTWYKDGHQMVSGDAYTVTGNELQIKRSSK